MAGAALATILLLKNDDPQQRQKIFSVLAEAPKRREALRLRMVFNLIGADHAFSPLSDSIRRRIRHVMESDGVHFGVLGESIWPAVSMSYVDSGNHGRAIEILQRVIEDPRWT